MPLIARETRKIHEKRREQSRNHPGNFPTKDTYQFADEPYFGYMCGGYTGEEFRDVDTFAAALGMVRLPCPARI